MTSERAPRNDLEEDELHDDENNENSNLHDPIIFGDLCFYISENSSVSADELADFADLLNEPGVSGEFDLNDLDLSSTPDDDGLDENLERVSSPGDDGLDENLGRVSAPDGDGLDENLGRVSLPGDDGLDENLGRVSSTSEEWRSYGERNSFIDSNMDSDPPKHSNSSIKEKKDEQECTCDNQDEGHKREGFRNNEAEADHQQSFPAGGEERNTSNCKVHSKDDEGKESEHDLNYCGSGTFHGENMEPNLSIERLTAGKQMHAKVSAEMEQSAELLNKNDKEQTEFAQSVQSTILRCARLKRGMERLEAELQEIPKLKCPSCKQGLSIKNDLPQPKCIRVSKESCAIEMSFDNMAALEKWLDLNNVDVTRDKTPVLMEPPLQSTLSPTASKEIPSSGTLEDSGKEPKREGDPDTNETTRLPSDAIKNSDEEVAACGKTEPDSAVLCDRIQTEFSQGSSGTSYGENKIQARTTREVGTTIRGNQQPERHIASTRWNDRRRTSSVGGHRRSRFWPRYPRMPRRHSYAGRALQQMPPTYRDKTENVPRGTDWSINQPGTRSRSPISDVPGGDAWTEGLASGLREDQAQRENAFREAETSLNQSEYQRPFVNYYGQLPPLDSRGVPPPQYWVPPRFEPCAWQRAPEEHTGFGPGMHPRPWGQQQ